MQKKSLRRVVRPCAYTLLVFVVGAALISGRADDKKKVDERRSYALIFGTVWTPDSRAAYGVTVKIRPAGDKKAKWTLVSDRRGEFAQRVPPGPADYVIWAEVPKKKNPIAETKIHIDNDERADVGLHLTE